MPLSISVLIPVRNGGEGLRLCLEALLAGDRRPDQLLVMDDGSTDGSPELAARLGATVLHGHSETGNAAHVRNLGARTARGDLLVFLDADVVVHPDTLASLERHFLADPLLDGLFGSYDDAPPGSLVSRYKNLEHHYVHQHARRDTASFWTGCGALRREAFLAVGGFNERYHGAAIEDIDLGWRLRRAGYRLLLCPEVQGTHLKQWTFWNLVHTDILHRAAPWTLLLLRAGALPNDLNLTWNSRLSALLAWAALVGLFAAFWQPWSLAAAGVGLLGLFALNAPLYALFLRRGGPALALAGFGLHALYFLYSSATFVLVALREALRRPRHQETDPGAPP